MTTANTATATATVLSVAEIKRILENALEVTVETGPEWGYSIPRAGHKNTTEFALAVRECLNHAPTTHEGTEQEHSAFAADWRRRMRVSYL